MSNQFVEPYDDRPWLRSITKDDHGTDCEGPFLRDLNDSLKTVIHDQQRLGQTKQQAKHVQYWGEVLKHIRQDISSSYWEEEYKVTRIQGTRTSTNGVKSGTWEKHGCGKYRTRTSREVPFPGTATVHFVENTTLEDTYWEVAHTPNIKKCTSIDTMRLPEP